MTDVSAMYRERADTLTDERGPEGAPPVVFSHGTLMDRTMFAPQLDALDDGSYRLLAYDSRSRTDNWEGPYGLDALVEDCRTLLDARGIDSCVLVGMSVGGFTALRFALAHPERLDGLVLVDAPAGPTTDGERESYRALIDELESLDRPTPELARRVAERVTSDRTRAERPELLERWARRWETYRAGAVAAEYGAWYDRDGVLDRLDEIETPALVVHGEEDVFEIERARETAERLPNGRLAAIPGAGHLSNLERPDRVTEALREFLAGVY